MRAAHLAGRAVPVGIQRWRSRLGILGALVDAAAHAEGDKARRSHLASALDSEGQLDALQQLQLISLLKLPPSKIITHSEALDRKTVNKIMTRRSDWLRPAIPS